MKKTIFRISAVVLLNLSLIVGLLLVSNQAIGYGPEDKCAWKMDCWEPENEPNCIDCLDNCDYVDCSWLWCGGTFPSCVTGTDCFCDDAPN